MKRCPQCERTFADEFSFCLEDGAILSPPLHGDTTARFDARGEPTEFTVSGGPTTGEPTEAYRPQMFSSGPSQPLQPNYIASVPKPTSAAAKAPGGNVKMVALMAGFLVLLFGGMALMSNFTPQSTQVTKTNVAGTNLRTPIQVARDGFPQGGVAPDTPSGTGGQYPAYSQPSDPAQTSDSPQTNIEGTGVDETIYSPEEVDESVVISTRPQAAYPESARRNGISGTVHMEAVFAATGKVTEIKIIQGLSHGLGESAAAAVRRATFTPAKKNGQPVSVRMPITYSFTIQ